MKWLVALVAVVVAVVGVVLWTVTRSTTLAPTVEAASWTFDSAEGNTLSISVGTGACDDFDRTDTSEDANTVTVHAFTRAKLGLEDAPASWCSSRTKSRFNWPRRSGIVPYSVATTGDLPILPSIVVPATNLLATVNLSPNIR